MRGRCEVYFLLFSFPCFMAQAAVEVSTSARNQGTSVPLLSDYASKLEPHVKDRYLQKIAVIGIDPVTIVGNYANPECLPPPMESTDILCYLVLETSFYAKEQFKNFQSLEAYNQMVSGWITGVQGHIIAEKFVVLAKIHHSQRMNDPLVSVWIITSKEGEITSAHCLGCKAGLGETCSHVPCVLFYLEAWTKIKGKLACTQLKCTWILPSFVSEVNYARVSDIDFTSSKKGKANLDIQIENLSADGKSPSRIIPPSSGKKVNSIPRASNEEMATFYEELNEGKIKPVAFSLVRPYSEQFVNKSRNAPAIPDLFDQKYMEHSYPELLKVCSEVELSLTPEEIKQIISVNVVLLFELPHFIQISASADYHTTMF